MKDWKIVVAFDVDDTLIIPNIAMNKGDRPIAYSIYPNYIEPAGYRHQENIGAYFWYQKQWCYMIVWSGTGVDWAEKWAKELCLNPDEIRVKEKGEDVDISVDDCNVDLANINIKVKRLNNQISRKEWNKTKHI